MRRLLALPLLGLVLVAVGCGGTPSPQGKGTIAFVERHAQLPDAKLARLCPSLYPRDFLQRHKHYRYDTKDLRYKPSAREKADARRAGCTAQGTKPE